MSEIGQLQQKQRQTHVLVCVNFLMFVVLFSALGYVAWQSAALVNRLKGDLDRAEQTIAGLQERFQRLDTEVIVERLVASATERLGEALGNKVADTDLAAPIRQAADKLAATQDILQETGAALQTIQQTIAGVDNEEIARLVSYHILNGLGDGFQQAAQSRKPADAGTP